MDFKIFEDEIHISTYEFLKPYFITVNGERYDLVQVITDRQTRKKDYLFAKNYFNNGN